MIILEVQKLSAKANFSEIQETENVSNEQAIDQYNALEVDRNETSNKVDHAEDKCNRYLRKYIHFN